MNSYVVVAYESGTCQRLMAESVEDAARRFYSRFGTSEIVFPNVMVFEETDGYRFEATRTLQVRPHAQINYAAVLPSEAQP